MAKKGAVRKRGRKRAERRSFARVMQQMSAGPISLGQMNAIMAEEGMGGFAVVEGDGKAFMPSALLLGAMVPEAVPAPILADKGGDKT